MAGREAALLGSRLFVAELDSLEQAAIFRGHERARDAAQEVVGMLRTTLLVGHSIVLTDSMLLDGAFFAQTSPERLAQLLGYDGDTLPLTVLTGTGSLREGFENKFRNPDFVWSVSSVLGLDKDGIRERAEPWIAAAEHGAFQVTPWGGEVRPPAAEGGFISSRPPAAWDLSAPARALLSDLLATRLRSDVVHQVATAREQGEMSDDEVNDVRDWWHAAYLEELAVRNGARWIRFGEPLEEDIPRTSKTLGVSGALIELAREATPDAYGTLQFMIRRQKSRFLERSTMLRLGSLVYAATSALEPPDRLRALTGAGIRILLALVVVLGAYPFLPDSFAGIDVALISFAIVSFATVPWDDVLDMVRLLRFRRRAELAVSGAP